MKTEKMSTLQFLQKKFGRIIIVAFALIAIPLILIAVLTNQYQTKVAAKFKPAKERLCKQYEQIDVTDVIAQKGGACVVTDDLMVIPLGGDTVFAQDRITKEQWLDFLMQVGELEQFRYDVAYCEGGGYYLVLKLPVALTMNFVFTSNSDNANNTRNVSRLLPIICKC